MRRMLALCLVALMSYGPGWPAAAQEARQRPAEGSGKGAGGGRVILDRPVKAAGLMLFPVVGEPKSYLYAPMTPRLARDAQGRPQFSFLRYVQNVAGSGGQDAPKEGEGGGILHAVVTLDVPASQLERAQQELEAKDSGAKIVGPAIYQSGQFALVSAVEAGGNDPAEKDLPKLAHEIVGLGTAPVLEGGKAAVSILLTKLGAEMLWQSFHMPTPDISFKFEMKLPGFWSPAKARIVADLDQVYQHERIQAAGATPMFEFEIKKAVEEMMEKRAIQVEIIGGGGDTEFTKYVDAAHDAIKKLIFDDAKSANATAGGAGGSVSDSKPGGAKSLLERAQQARRENREARKATKKASVEEAEADRLWKLYEEADARATQLEAEYRDARARLSTQTRGAPDASTGTGDQVAKVGEAGTPPPKEAPAEGGSAPVGAPDPAKEPPKAEEGAAVVALKPVAKPEASGDKEKLAVEATPPTAPDAKQVADAGAQPMEKPAPVKPVATSKPADAAAPQTGSSDEKRLADEKKAAEEKRIADQKKAAEEKRLADEKRAAEAKRIAEEKKKADEKALQTAGTKAETAAEKELAAKKADAEKARSEATALRGRAETARTNANASAAQASEEDDQIEFAGYASYELKQTRRTGRFEYSLDKYSNGELGVRFDENIGDLSRYLDDPQFFRAVNLDDPLYKQREIDVKVDGTNSEDFGKFVNFVTVQLRKRHQNGDVTTDEVRIDRNNFNQAGNRFRMLYGWKGDDDREAWLAYEWRAIWSFFGGRDVEEPWQTTLASGIAAVPPYKRRSVSLEADPEEVKAAGVRAITVRLYYDLAGKEMTEQVTLNASRGELSSSVPFMLADGKYDYGYDISWRLRGNRVVEQPRATTTEAILFVDELPETPAE